MKTAKQRDSLSKNWRRSAAVMPAMILSASCLSGNIRRGPGTQGLRHREAPLTKCTEPRQKARRHLVVRGKFAVFSPSKSVAKATVKFKPNIEIRAMGNSPNGKNVNNYL
jgi:hypothetical protein